MLLPHHTFLFSDIILDSKSRTIREIDHRISAQFLIWFHSWFLRNGMWERNALDVPDLYESLIGPDEYLVCQYIRACWGCNFRSKVIHDKLMFNPDDRCKPKLPFFNDNSDSFYRCSSTSLHWLLSCWYYYHWYCYYNLLPRAFQRRIFLDYFLWLKSRSGERKNAFQCCCRCAGWSSQYKCWLLMGCIYCWRCNLPCNKRIVPRPKVQVICKL